MNLKQRIAQRVLDLRVTVELYVRARPHLVEGGTLGGGQRLEPESSRLVKTAVDAADQRRRVGARIVAVLGCELDQPQR